MEGSSGQKVALEKNMKRGNKNGDEVNGGVIGGNGKSCMKSHQFFLTSFVEEPI